MTRKCANCGTSYSPRKSDARYCSRKCNDDSRNRALLRSNALYRDLYHWAAGTRDVDGAKLGSPFTILSRAARQWVAEDKAAGRAPPPLPYDMETRRLQRSYEARVAHI